MLTRKCLGITSLVAGGLIAGCSSDSTSSPKDDIAELIDNASGNINACIYDGYSAMQGANGETLCLDAEGTLAFWINTDGTYGFPEAAQGTTESGTTDTSSTEQSETTAPESSAASTEGPSDPSTPSTGEPSINSSSSVTGCTTDKALYTVNGISYYKNDDGSLYYFDTDCNKTNVTVAEPASSSSVNSESSESAASSNSRPGRSSSSEVTTPASSSSNATPNSSADAMPSSSANTTPSSSSVSVVVPSNGSTPTITYAASGATVENNNNCVTVTGGEVVITCAGDYDFSGSYSGADAQIRVYSPKSDSGVYLNLRGLTLTNTADAPIYAQMASKTFVVAKSGTTNTLSDGSSRTKTFTYLNSNNETKVDTTGACIYAKDDLTLKGEGTLIVKGNYNNGIHTTNDLRVRGNTTINVTAKNNGLKGKGIVDIEAGNITIAATNGDGIKSDEGEDENTISEGKGIVDIKGGKITITKAGDDGIQAFNYVFIRDTVSVPTINVTSTGKGIVSTNRIYINAGKISVSSGDDGIHSNMNVYFNGGETTISSGDDGIHADSTLLITDGSINITKAVEGMEAFYIKAQGGKTATVASDDAWNAAGGSADGNTSSGSQWGGPGGPGGMMSSSKGYIIISGGYHYLYAAGNDVDVLDANGTATMSGGVLLLEIGSSGGMGGGRGGNSSSGCSTNMAGGMIDTDNGFTISGGVLLGFGNQTEEYPSCSATSFTAGTAYGTTNAAFKPSGSGSMIIYGGSVKSVSQVDVGSMKEVALPNGMSYYEK